MFDSFDQESRDSRDQASSKAGEFHSDFETDVAGMEAEIIRPVRKNEPARGPWLSMIRQRVESIFQTCKDILALERHGARTLENLRVRIAQRLLALATCVYINHWLGRPSRSLVSFAT